MLRTAVVMDPERTAMSDADLAAVAEQLSGGDRVVVVFREPSSLTPETTRVWHGTVVVPRSAKYQRRRCKWVRYDEAGWQLMFPFPPFAKDVSVLDVFIEAAQQRKHKTRDPSWGDVLDESGGVGGTSPPCNRQPTSPPAQEGSLFKDQAVSFVDPCISLNPSMTSRLATTDENSFTFDGTEGATGDSAAAAPITGASNSLRDVRALSTDMLNAMSKRLYPHRRYIVWVCMPSIDGVTVSEELVEDMEVEIVSFRSPRRAEEFITANVASIVALVTSSLRNEFEREGICGVDLCNLVRELRDKSPLPDNHTAAERAFPLCILATKTLPMGDCVESCDIFIHALNPTQIALREVSRRLAPPSVVWITSTQSSSPPDSLRRRLEGELQLSLHVFDTTYRALQYILACPWNLAALVTDRCDAMLRGGHVTGIELARRLKSLTLCRFAKPRLILIGLPESHEASTINSDFDNVVNPELPEEELNEHIFRALQAAREDCLRRSTVVPGAVVFGRGSHVSLATTFPSPFVITIDNETMTFPNVEQFFQAAKHYGCPELFAKVRDSASVHGALQAAWQRKISSREWNLARDDVMLFALMQKFSQEEFAHKLLLTGDKEIIHATSCEEDVYWGDGADRSSHRGRNRLGEMLSTIRTMLQQRSPLIMKCPLRKMHSANADTRGSASTNVFEISKEVLGRGSYSVVYKARDMFTNQIVAAKVASNVPTADKALRRELDLLMRVDDTNVVKVLHADLSSSDGRATVFMEYMVGGSLEGQAQVYRFYEAAIRNAVAQILDGLEALHKRYGIVHCDLKPGNVLIGSSVVKISDFGASAMLGVAGSTAKPAGNDAAALLGAPGTPVYMSPERMESNKASIKDDIWALGCIVVRLALGQHRHPWWQEGDPNGPLNPYTVCYRMTNPPHRPYIPEHLSPFAKAFVLRCFTYDPESRPDAEMLKKDAWFTSECLGMEAVEDYTRLRKEEAPAHKGTAAFDANDTLMNTVAVAAAAQDTEGRNQCADSDGGCVTQDLGCTRGLETERDSSEPCDSIA